MCIIIAKVIADMHHTRKTHNAHNETQRRLKKIASKREPTRPHYNIVHFYNNSDEISWIEPCWEYDTWSSEVCRKCHIGTSCIKTIEESEKAKKHSFYSKHSKSESKYWRFAKKRLHRIWRRKAVDELTFTYKDAVGCSLFDLY